MDPSASDCTTSEYATWCVPAYVVIIPKITGAISFICSAYLAKLMVSEEKKKPYHRLLLNISIADMISSSVVHTVGSWMMPAGTAPLSKGNLTTCDAQGFLVQIILITIPYLNASLSTYYNLIIRYNWSDSQIAKVEKKLHIIPWVLGILFSIIVLVAKQIVPGTWGCWFGNTQYPPGCDSAETCVRGWNSSYYFWPIFVIILLAPLYVAGSMYLVYSSTRKMERRMTRYTSFSSVNACQNTSSVRSSRRSRKVMEQSLLFSAALLLTLLFPLVEIIINELGMPIPIWIHVVFALTNPLQGFYNLLIHLRRGNGFSLACIMPQFSKRESKEPKEREISLQQTSATTAIPNSAIERGSFVHTNEDAAKSTHIPSVSFALDETA